MKKILLLMALCVIIIIGFVATPISNSLHDFNDGVYKVVTTDTSVVGTICGDHIIYDSSVMPDNYTSISVTSSNYDLLKGFVSQYSLHKLNEYYVQGVCVSEYTSNWLGRYNTIQVADYGDKYILGYPYIFEGF